MTPILSFTSAEAFGCGVWLGPAGAARLIEHVRQCYATSRKIETVAAVEALPVLHGRPA